ncbi:molybdenum cofactor guanylyltransferase [Sphingomonas koreensis]|nr:molybdenum cofactor guanylyltransferase [Sphingomonas koreensis]
MILGAIIAGGRSSRFGSDKAEALLGGAPLIDHAAAVLRPFVDAIVLCGRDRAGWMGLDDVPRAGLGPLGGIAAALRYADAESYHAVLTIGCDMPRAPTALIEALIAEPPAYCRDAPILGCWPASLATDLERHVSTDPRRSIRGWGEAIGATPIASPEPLANINTLADLSKA